MPGVLGGNDIDLAQYPKCPEGDVFKIADGCSDDIQFPGCHRAIGAGYS